MRPTTKALTETRGQVAQLSKEIHELLSDLRALHSFIGDDVEAKVPQGAKNLQEPKS